MSKSRNIKSVAALGRLCQIGSLYSIFSDNFINDSTTHLDETIFEGNPEITKVNKTTLKIVSSETMQNKAKAIGLSDSERLSILCKLIPLSGATKFLSEKQQRDPNTVSITLKFEFRSESKFYDASKIKNSWSLVFPLGATHIVAGVEFGFDAFYIFQKKVEAGMSFKKTRSKLELIVANIIHSSKKNSLNDKFCEDIICNFFGDSQAESGSISFSEAVSSIKFLSETAPKSVAKFLLLHPIIKLDHSNDVETDLVTRAELLVSKYINVEERLTEFDQINFIEEVQSEVDLLKHLICVVRELLSEDLLGMVQEIRQSVKTWNELDLLINKYCTSGFSPQHFEQSLSEIFLSATTVDHLLKSAKSKNINFLTDNDLNDFISNLSDNELVVAFAINSSALASRSLQKLKLNVLSQDEGKCEENIFNQQIVYQDMQRMLTIFLQYSEANLSSSSKYILMCNESEDDAIKSADVFLYNLGSRCSIKLPYGLQPPVLTGTKGTHWVEVLIKSTTFGKEFVSEYLLHIHEKFQKGQESQDQKVIFPSNQSDHTVKLKNLTPGQKYIFKVQACSIAGLSPPSQWSEEVMTDAEIRLALQIFSNSIQVKDSNTLLDIYKPISNNSPLVDGLRKVTIGKNLQHQREKTILVVGATGTGKTTFLNSMVNYLYDVRLDDGFRLKIVTQSDEGWEDSKSKTKYVSAYCFHGTKLPYRLVVVDTPGYGDTDGLAADKRTTGLIKTLFENQGENGIDHLDAVCIVVKASDSRLTAQQRHNFNSVLQLFGKDIAPNLFIIATFCDASEPPVKASLQDANIDFTKFFKFNNSAFFEGSSNMSESELVFQNFYWKVGLTSFDNFFHDLQNTTPVSLFLSIEVLQKRVQLESLVMDLHSRVTQGISHLEQMRQEAQIMDSYEAKIKANKSFTYTIMQEKITQEDISGKGVHTTTCMTCNFTCHSSCAYADNKDKAGCIAMNSSTGDCKVCPQKCHWDIHKNVPYICKIIMEEVTKTDEDLRKKYLKATDDKRTKEMMIENLGRMFAKQQTENSQTITNIRSTIDKLHVIIIIFILIPSVLKRGSQLLK
jgi:hypothetical protein